MKKYVYLSACCLATLALYSCDEVSGTLNVTGDLKYLQKRELDSKTKKLCKKEPTNAACAPLEVLVPAGSHPARVGASDSKTYLLKLTDTKQELKFRIPEGKKLPKNSGDISLKASESGQLVDVVGVVDTQYSRSDNRFGSESCSYQVPNGYDCTVVRDQHGIDHQRCVQIYRTEYGRQDIEYHYDYTDKSLDLNLVDPVSGEVKASFRGTDHSSSQVVTYRGRCF